MQRRSKINRPQHRRQRRLLLESLQRRELLAADAATLLPTSPTQDLVNAGLVQDNVNESFAFAPIDFVVDTLQNDHRIDVVDTLAFPFLYQGAKRITSVGPTQQAASSIEISRNGTALDYSINGASGLDSFRYTIDGVYEGLVNVRILQPVVPDHYQVIAQGPDEVLDLLANDFLPNNGHDSFGVVSAEQGAALKATAKITSLLDVDPDEFQIAADGRSVIFKTPESESAFREFRYVVNDTFTQSASVQVSRGVADDQFRVDWRSDQNSLDVLANDRYVDRFSGQFAATSERITSVTQGTRGGRVEIAADGRTLQYTPATGFTGNESFEYFGDVFYRGRVTVSVDKFADDDRSNISLLTSTTIDVLGNDFDRFGQQLKRITSVSESSIGAVIEIEDNRIRYTVPDDAVAGQIDTFTYVADENYQGLVTVEIFNPAVADHVSVSRSVAMPLDVLANDQIGDDYFGDGRITDVTQPSGGGNVEIASDGLGLRFTPGSQSETFTYTIDETYSATVTTSAAAYLENDEAYIEQNEPVAFFDVLANDFDPQSMGSLPDYNGPKQLSIAEGSTAGATVQVVGDRIRYVPPIGFYGVDRFTYRVDEILTASVKIDVLRNVRDDHFYVDAESESLRLDVLANDIFGNHYQGAKTITAIDAGPLQVVEISADGQSLQYSVPSGLTGEHQFRYTVDGRYTAMVNVKIGESAEPFWNPILSNSEFADRFSTRAVEQMSPMFGRQPPAADGPFSQALSLCFTSEIIAFDSSPTFEPYQRVDSLNEVVENRPQKLIADDGYLYSLRGNDFAITGHDSDGRLSLFSQTSISGEPRGMFLDENRLTIVSSMSVPSANHATCGSTGIGESRALVSIYDVAERTSPRLVQRSVLDGDFVDAIHVGEEVAILVDKDWGAPPLRSICDDTGACRYETEAEYHERLQQRFAATVEDTLPLYQAFDGDDRPIRSGTIPGPDDLYFDAATAGNADIVKMIATFDPQSDEPGLKRAIGFVADRDAKLSVATEGILVLDSMEGESLERTQTRIQQFEWAEQTGIRPLASGTIPGVIDAKTPAEIHDGIVRVISSNKLRTTEPDGFATEFSFLAFENSRGRLTPTGHTHGLATEGLDRIHFEDDLALLIPDAYLADIEVVDLADPNSPASVGIWQEINNALETSVLGSTTVAGGVRYLRPLSSNLVIVVQGDAEVVPSRPWNVALFDVTDLGAPQLLDEFKLSGESFDFSRGDKEDSFGWFPEQGVFAVPLAATVNRSIESAEGSVSPSFLESDQVLLLSVDDSTGTLAELGRVTHFGTIQDLRVIDQVVYSVGTEGVQSLPLENLLAAPNLIVFDDSVEPDRFEVGTLTKASIVDEARTWLAGQLGLSEDELWLKAFETPNVRKEMLFRVGETAYRVWALPGTEHEFQSSEFRLGRNLHHNLQSPTDVNGDARVSPIDALLVMNQLEIGTSFDVTDTALRQIFPRSGIFGDVNQDGMITPRDVLLIINQLARAQSQDSASGELVDFLRDDEDDTSAETAYIPRLF